MNVLGVIKQAMVDLDIPYEYMEFTSPVTGMYWVGEYTESPITAEDGSKQGTVFLTGTTRESWLELEKTRAKIENHFHPISGLHETTDNGAVAIFYSHCITVPTGETNLKRIQIDLDIKEWRDNQ